MNPHVVSKAYEGIDGELGAPAGVGGRLGHTDELLQSFRIGSDFAVSFRNFTHAAEGFIFICSP